jgi:ribonuclease-3
MTDSILGYSFRNPDLLREALTHPSTCEEISNQRLEFLGDAVIDLIIAEHLYIQRPDFAEGDMTLAKSSIVNGKTLAKAAVLLGLGERIEAGGGLKERKSWPDSVYCDAMEAVAGAVYLDGGLDAAREMVLKALGQYMERLASTGVTKNHKSVLGELTQAGSQGRPNYKVIAEDGPPHRKTFTVSVTVGDLSGEGKGPSKKEAEERAAEDLLRKSQLA